MPKLHPGTQDKTYVVVIDEKQEIKFQSQWKVEAKEYLQSSITILYIK